MSGYINDDRVEHLVMIMPGDGIERRAVDLTEWEDLGEIRFTQPTLREQVRRHSDTTPLLGRIIRRGTQGDIQLKWHTDSDIALGRKWLEDAR